MRIDLSGGASVPDSNLDRKAQKGSVPSTPVNDAAGEPQFSVNQAGVSALAATSLGQPEIRAARVAALQAQIAAGTYRVSSQQISSSILEQLRAAN